MITSKIVTIGTRQFQKTASDTYLIRQIETGKVYQEAVDILPCVYTYEETDMVLTHEELSETEQKAKAYDILMGVSE